MGGKEFNIVSRKKRLCRNFNSLGYICTVHFSSVPWPIGSSGGHKGRFSRDPLLVFSAGGPCQKLWHWQGYVHSLVLSIQHSSADHSIIHPPRCPEGWFWRGCHGMWRAETMQVSLAWQQPEEVLLLFLCSLHQNYELHKRVFSYTVHCWFYLVTFFHIVNTCSLTFPITIEGTLKFYFGIVIFLKLNDNFCWPCFFSFFKVSSTSCLNIHTQSKTHFKCKANS